MKPVLREFIYASFGYYIKEMEIRETGLALPCVPQCRRRRCPRGSISRVPLVTPTTCEGKAYCADSLTGATLIGALASAMYDLFSLR